MDGFILSEINVEFSVPGGARAYMRVVYRNNAVRCQFNRMYKVNSSVANVAYFNRRSASTCTTHLYGRIVAP